MPIHEDSMSLLQQIYADCQTNRSYNIDFDTYRNMESSSRKVLNNCIKYLRDSYYIEPFTICSGFPVSYTITANGIREIEEVNKAESSSTVYNIIQGNNYGVAANTATCNTINNGNTLADITALIEKTVSSKEEQKELLDATSQLFDRIEKGYPIEKGLLSKVKDSLGKYQTIIAAIVPKVLDYLMSSK